MRLPFDLGILGTDPDTQKVLTKAVLLGHQTAFLSVVATAKVIPPHPLQNGNYTVLGKGGREVFREDFTGEVSLALI